jgi:hypothetical protein
MKLLIAYSVLALLFYGVARITRRPAWRVKRKRSPVAPTVTLMVLLHLLVTRSLPWLLSVPKGYTRWH